MGSIGAPKMTQCTLNAQISLIVASIFHISAVFGPIGFCFEHDALVGLFYHKSKVPDPIKRFRGPFLKEHFLRGCLLRRHLLRESLFIGRFLEDISWVDVFWKNISWEDASWEDISWEDVFWEDVSWEDVSWEDVFLEDVSWENVCCFLNGRWCFSKGCISNFKINVSGSYAPCSGSLV